MVDVTRPPARGGSAPDAGEGTGPSRDRPHRRVLPRQVVNWRGHYRLEGDPEGCWRACRVVDFSPAGAGIDLLDTTVEEAAGRHIVVEVELCGEVRNAGLTRGGGVRVGARFVDAGDDVEQYVESLSQIDARW